MNALVPLPVDATPVSCVRTTRIYEAACAPEGLVA